MGINLVCNGIFGEYVLLGTSCPKYTFTLDWLHKTGLRYALNLLDSSAIVESWRRDSECLVIECNRGIAQVSTGYAFHCKNSVRLFHMTVNQKPFASIREEMYINWLTLI